MRGALFYSCCRHAWSRGAPATFRAPARLRQALATSIGALEASAELVPEGATPLAAIPLDAGEDGVSFTGFIAATRGTYTLEIMFTGVFTGGSERSFLGRWPSDTFTVAEGDTVSPIFSKPLDTIGRPGDGGDLDGDGLGLIDELLWGADRTRADSDSDGLRDGDDCDPIDPARAYPIVSGGSIEDCDGDGALRMDLTYKPGGTDCNDRDPAKQICPIDDREGPSIAILDPMPDETVGCHRRIRAHITDPSGVDIAPGAVPQRGRRHRSHHRNAARQRATSTSPTSSTSRPTTGSRTGCSASECAPPTAAATPAPSPPSSPSRSRCRP